MHAVVFLLSTEDNRNILYCFCFTMHALVFLLSTEDGNVLTCPCLGIAAVVFTQTTEDNNMHWYSYYLLKIAILDCDLGLVFASVCMPGIRK